MSSSLMVCRLSLALLISRLLLVDHVDLAAAPYDLVVRTSFLD